MTGQCVFCGHQHLTAKTTRYLHQNQEAMLVVEQVLCLECDFCSEQYFDIQVLKKLKPIMTTSTRTASCLAALCRLLWQNLPPCNAWLFRATLYHNSCHSTVGRVESSSSSGSMLLS